MTDLYFYADAKQAERILEQGYVTPGPDGLIWAVSMSWPVKAALGGISRVQDWSQTPVRFRLVDPEIMMPWKDLQHVLTGQRVFELGLTQGAMPEYWFGSSMNRIEVVAEPY